MRKHLLKKYSLGKYLLGKYLLSRSVKYLFAVIVSLVGCTLAQGVIDLKIAGPNDDAEELVGESAVGPAGSAYLDSSDLELVDDADTTQIVGLRFTGLELAPNTPITRAYIQFTVDEASTDPAALTIYAEASDNAEAFSDTPELLSGRSPTALSVDWTPAPWSTPGEATEAQQTPDLSGLIQEIINRPGWQSGNAIVLMLIGEGKRVAEAFDGSRNGAAVLHIEFETPTEQVAEAGESQTETPENSSEETASEAAPPATETAPETAAPETATSEAETPETATSETAADPAPAASNAQTEATETAQAPAPQPQPDPANGKRYAITGESVTGSVLISDYGNGTVIVTVLVNEQARNDVYGARLNIGSCNAPGTVLLDLEPVRGDRGSLSVTASAVDYATLTQADLNLTLSPSPESSETIACGEVGAP